MIGRRDRVLGAAGNAAHGAHSRGYPLWASMGQTEKNSVWANIFRVTPAPWKRTSL